MTNQKLTTFVLCVLAGAVFFVQGCDGDTPIDKIGGDADTDADTDGDTDTDTDADADGPTPLPTPDFTDEELAVHRDFDWDKFCGDETFDTIDPEWLTHAYEGEWPDPAAANIQMGACFPNYDPNFWTHLACYNTQTEGTIEIDGNNYSCWADWKDAPPMGTPFSCSSYRCRFCESMLYDEAGYHYPDICTEEDARWECTSCYYELKECLWEATENGACAMENAPKMYQVQPALRDCYMQVTGFDRCRWVLPDVCDGIAECSGPEWPPV